MVKGIGSNVGVKFDQAVSEIKTAAKSLKGKAGNQLDKLESKILTLFSKFEWASDRSKLKDLNSTFKQLDKALGTNTRIVDTAVKGHSSDVAGFRKQLQNMKGIVAEMKAKGKDSEVGGFEGTFPELEKNIDETEALLKFKEKQEEAEPTRKAYVDGAKTQLRAQQFREKAQQLGEKRHHPHTGGKVQIPKGFDPTPAGLKMKEEKYDAGVNKLAENRRVGEDPIHGFDKPSEARPFADSYIGREGLKHIEKGYKAHVSEEKRVTEAKAQELSLVKKEVKMDDALKDLLAVADKAGLRGTLGKWKGEKSDDNRALNDLLEEGVLDKTAEEAKDVAFETLQLIDQGLVQLGLATRIDENNITVNDKNPEVKAAYGRAVDAYNALEE